MSEVLLYECGPEPGIGVRSVLDRESYRLVTCDDGAALIEDLADHRPDAVIYVLRPHCPQDLAILQLLRRFAPALPIIVLAHETSIAQQRIVQSLRPIYFTVAPVGAAEIRGAVDAALRRRAATAGSVSRGPASPPSIA